jgi:hypothetical protein
MSSEKGMISLKFQPITDLRRNLRVPSPEQKTMSLKIDDFSTKPDCINCFGRTSSIAM